MKDAKILLVNLLFTAIIVRAVGVIASSIVLACIAIGTYVTISRISKVFRTTWEREHSEAV